ncbi:dihydrolipoyllysine-residue succinyltransferase component of 2-oxoglutarate dehydrogenase complex [Ktedonobacter sp. SOSP1-85]|uniref:2-oxoglutarate dehydrogenase complex dihydrolipoyllysine-residue succinyltransferase n=1 Tax=Ktedonobacter sp. SOSP1-85 TaxID=2778367 RepID=UPI001915C342|nr:2-oxoglutarate dehydrogenase complex dihydrolipoyllysine-residue succinyltransferase [Ktedonobacter sp. SOSP1-85]GHO72594.1 dihydrolipoyllysine-residue succinyltransferase component of 2-oxoglutarate dehydrogenase complex [Ktedonobacter sp. SOSP1-85]
MSDEIRVPILGESIVDATIATWLKKEGDAVHQGETLAELETDKVNVEVNAEQDGVIHKILKREGETVQVGEVIAFLGQEAQVSGKGSSNGAIATAPAPQSEEIKRTTSQPLTSAGESQRPPSPLARRIAAEHNVDISQVRGSSPHGRVTKEDVMSYLEESSSQAVPATTAVSPQTTPAAPSQAVQPVLPPAQPAADASRREERVRMSRRRQTIAQRLVEAQHTAAMLTTFNEIDMSAVMDVRSRRKEAFKERHNVSLGFMSFFTKAVVGALKAFPRLNAEIQGNEMVLKHYYDIGIAVGAEEGLVVPVVRDADRKSFAAIEREIGDLAKRARTNTLSLAELQGGTFTITNGGTFGSMLSTPILNGPQVGILGMHKIEQRPVAIDGQVVIRPMMYVALSYDHRIVDGSEAVRFLVKVKELVEDPEALLLEG